LTLLILIAAIGTITAFRQRVHYEAPYPEITASTDTAVIARGRHLVISSAHCINCHSTLDPDSLLRMGKEPALTGGVLFNLPIGKIYSRNITPDPETGIGRFSDPEIARALRFGVHPDGTAVFDFMPFHNTSDEDLTAIISYLRAQKPVKNEVPVHDLNIAGNLVKAFMVKPVGPTGPVPERVKPDTTAEYGRYLTLSVAECNGCHTQRNMAGEFTGEPFAGGGPMDENGHILVPPNLTTDSTSRIFGWSQEDFLKRFRMGKLIPYSVMPWNSYQRMTDNELKAVYAYLRTVKPAKTTKVE
jgi:mono/diheme cytochrome c family protein